MCKNRYSRKYFKKKTKEKWIKLKDHSFFGAFAPRNNPKIAIAVMCENAGFGATVAGPIASLLIEKYLKDSITSKSRLAEIEETAKKKIIPSYIQEALNKMEAEKQAKLDSINGLLDMDKEAKDALEEIEDSKPIIPLKPIKDDNKKPVSTPKDSMTLVKKEEED